MAVKSQVGLIEALARADYDAVLGTAESHWVDFKRDPYVLDSPKGQWELAKDVAAMAESRGGVIVIGYATEKHATEGIETASEHHPVPKKLIIPDRYRAVIDNRVYPPVPGIGMHWFPPGSAEDDGVFVVEIPSQAEESKPFAVTRMLDDDETEQAHFVGLPRRGGDRVRWTKPETIHHQINIGRRISGLRAFTSEPTIESQELIDAELDSTVRAADAEEEPWLAFQATPSMIGRPPRDPLMLERMRSVLVDPPSLRPGGFNFRSASPPEWVAGSTLELVGHSFALRVVEKGILTACFAANDSCLGWALSQHLQPGSPLRINPLTLVEYTLEYFRLLDLQVAALFDETSWPVQVVARGMKQHLIVLDPGPLRGKGIPLTPPSLDHLARADEWKGVFLADLDPENDGFRALLHVYALFGLPATAIPYSENERLSASLVRQQ